MWLSEFGPFLSWSSKFDPSLHSSLIFSWTKVWKACLSLLTSNLVSTPLGIMMFGRCGLCVFWVVFTPWFVFILCSSPCTRALCFVSWSPSQSLHAPIRRLRGSNRLCISLLYLQLSFISCLQNVPPQGGLIFPVYIRFVTENKTHWVNYSEKPDIEADGWNSFIKNVLDLEQHFTSIGSAYWIHIIICCCYLMLFHLLNGKCCLLIFKFEFL